MRGTFGFAIEGLGPPSDTSKQYMIVARAPSFSLAGFDYAPVLKEFPAEVRQTLPWPGGMTIQSTLKIGVGDLVGYPEIPQFLASHRPRPAGVLDTNLAVGTTTMVWEDFPGEDSIVQDEVVFLQREKLEITGSVSTSDSDSDGKDENSATVARAVHGTRALKVNGLRVDEDKFLYKRNQIVEGRRCKVYEIDHDAQTASVIWTGFIESPDSEDESQIFIEFTARSSIAAAGKRGLGTDRLYMWGVVGKSSQGYALYETEADTRMTPLPTPASPGAGQYFSAFRVGDAIVKASLRKWYDGDGGIDAWDILPGTRLSVLSGSPGSAVDLASHSILSNDENRELEGAEKVRGWEVLTTLTDDLNYFVDDTATASTHVSDIVRCILASTGEMTWVDGVRTLGSNGDFDALPSSWGLSFPDDLIDHDSFERFKNAGFPYEDLELNNFVMGNEADPPKANEFLDDLLASVGLTLYMGNNGKLKLGTIYDDGRKSAVPLYYSDHVVKGSLRRCYRMWPPLQDIKISAFRKWPGKQYNEIMLHADIGQVRPRRYGSMVEDVVISADHLGDPGFRRWLRSTRDPMEAIHGQYYLLRNEPLPVYSMEVDGALASQLELTGLIDFTCVAVLDGEGAFSITDHTCVIVQHSRDLKYGTVWLECIDLHYAARATSLIAPSFDIISKVSDTQFTIRQYYSITNGDPLYTSDWELLSDRFTLLSKCALYGLDGVQKGSVADMSTFNKATGEIVMSGGGFGVTVAVGDVIRIPEYDDGTQAQASEWTHIAKSNGKQGVDNDDGDRWGL